LSNTQINRRRFLWLSAVGAGSLLAACGGSQAASPAPASSAGSAASAAAGPGSAAAKASAAPAAAGNPLAKMEDVLAAAKKEGTMTLITQPDPAYQKFIQRVQQALPWLKVEHSPFRPTEFIPRILSEQRNGQFLWDLHLGPASGMLSTMAPAGSLQPIKPFLEGLQASTSDDSKWGGGFQIFTDDSNPVTLVTEFVKTGGTWVNRDKLPADQFSKDDQLIDPKFKGQIVIYDPTKDNGGSQSVAALLVSKGEDFARKLLKDQQPVIVADSRQGTQWLAEGRYPLGLGTDINIVEDFKSKGLGKGVERMDGDAIYLHSTGVSAFKTPPHPNAIKAFFNWFLSQEGQDGFAADIPDGNSRRLDVKVYHPIITPDYSNLAQYKFRLVTPQGAETIKKVNAIATS
jgi:iron(III) transport system substrate-binding protein